MTDSMISCLTAADLMTTGLRTCSPFSSVAEASLILRGVDCGAIPVVDAGEAIGVLTDRDIALAVADHPDIASLPVSEIMSKNPISVPLSATIAEIQAKFIEHGVKRLLVVDQTGQLQGLIATIDLALRGVAEPSKSS